MSPNTGLCSDWRRASNHQRTRWRAAVAVPAVTPELKGYHYTVRSCGRSGRAGDKWDRGTRRVMKSDFKGREGRQEVLLFFFSTSLFSYRHTNANEATKWNTHIQLSLYHHLLCFKSTSSRTLFNLLDGKRIYLVSSEIFYCVCSCLMADLPTLCPH